MIKLKEIVNSWISYITDWFKNDLTKETVLTRRGKWRQLTKAQKIQLAKNMKLKGKTDEVKFSRASQIFNNRTTYFDKYFIIIDWETLEVFMPKGMYSKK